MLGLSTLNTIEKMCLFTFQSNNDDISRYQSVGITTKVREAGISFGFTQIECKFCGLLIYWQQY